MGFHFKLSFTHLHGIGITQVNEVGIADIRKQHIGKTGRVVLPKRIKIGLPEKVYKLCQFGRWFYAVVILLKMRNMKKLGMLHKNRLCC